MKKILFIIIAITFLTACKSNHNRQSDIHGDLIVFHAGSLSVPLSKIASSYEKEHPNVNIKLEAAGSVASARKITDLNKYCDVFASADYRVIDKMLIPKYSSWNIKMATNEISIIYSKKSKYADIINSDNCFDILLKDDVYYGRSDPNSDPCGYRTVLACKLAAKIYSSSRYCDSLLMKDNRFMRPKASDLIALLQINAIDYIFEYKSIAIQNGFKYIELPDSINLSNPNLNEWYKTVETKINGEKPGEHITIQGENIIYGITAIDKTKNPVLSYDFINYVLNKQKGMKVLNKNGQEIIYPPLCEDSSKLPESLRWIKQ